MTTMDPVRGVLALDFESCSALDIDNGAWAYSQHESTRLWCACFGYAETVDGTRQFVDWLPGQPLPHDVAAFIVSGGKLVAHNASFERCMAMNVAKPRSKWPAVDRLQWCDTQALGLAVNLPLSLEGLAKALGCPSKKDEEGAKLMKELAVVKVVDGNYVYPEPTPEQLTRLVAYCRQDVAATLDCYFRLPSLSVDEQRLYLADSKINERGVWLDQAFAGECLRITETRAEELEVETFGASGAELRNSTGTPQLKTWLQSRGVVLPKARKKHTPFEWQWRDRTDNLDLSTTLALPRLPADIRALLLEPPPVATLETKVRNRLRTWIKRAGAEPDRVLQRRRLEPVWRWVETADRNAVLELLERHDLPADVREVLEVRQEANKATSLAKLRRVPTMTGTDGRLRFALQFCGAHTGRWSSSGLQLHNLPKNKLKTPLGPVPKGAVDLYPELVLLALQQGSLGFLKFLHKRPLEAVSQSLRSVIAAPPGSEIIGGDYSAIEARVVAWLAGQLDVLDLFARGEDVYTHAARNVGSDVRDLGKVCTLGLGYGMGPVKLMSTAAAPPYGIHLEPKESARVVRAWRATNSAIAELWGSVESAAFDAVLSSGRVVKAGQHLTLFCKGSCLFLRLPSGRCIRYWRPRIVRVEKVFKTIDDAGNIVEATRVSDELQFFTMGDDKTSMVIESTYGGKLVENATQGVARDLLGAAVVRFAALEDSKPYRLVMHVHDSAAAEVPLGAGRVDEFESIMATCPPWATGCPVKVDGYRAPRFKG